MSEDLERDDLVLGTALARAVDSQHPRETPFERSRLAARLAAPARRVPFGVALPGLAAAAALVLAVGFATFLAGQRTPPAQPSASAPVAPTRSPTPAVAPTATPAETAALRVWFARDQLPPAFADVQVPAASAGGGAAQRTRARLEALASAKAPGGSVNLLPTLRTHPVLKDVKVSGTVATIDYEVANGDWGAAGSAGGLALIQQLVYTASEEPGIRSVVITENGGKPTAIDQVAIDHPMTREEVAGYSFKGSDVSIVGNAGSGEQLEITRWSASNGYLTNGTSGIAGNLTLEVRRFLPSAEVGSGPTPTPARLDPTFNARLEPAKPCGLPGCAPAKWVLTLRVPADLLPSEQPTWLDGFGGPILAVDGQVVRPGGCVGAPCSAMVVVSLYLVDARPWRATLRPTGPGTAEIGIEVGGVPRYVNRSIAVHGLDWTLHPGATVGRTFFLNGAARVYEANVAWRVRDRGGREVASGHTLASVGTSPVWGTFSTEVKVPQGVSGPVTLEVFHVSPADGSELDLIAVPLTVR